MSQRSVIVRSIVEDRAGSAWQGHFARLWPTYRRWFLSEGPEARFSLEASRRRLRATMPELVPVYERLCELAAATGAGEYAQRFLTLYRPPPYLAGCSQLIETREGPALIRNYDFAPDLWEGVVWTSSWSGRRVVALSDCIWGALEGINDSGLAVGLSFGGRRVVGDGFGIPLVVRYLLEVCNDAVQCREALRAVGSHMAYNLAVLDAAGKSFVACLRPDGEPIFREGPAVTNHQSEVASWPAYEQATATRAREQWLLEVHRKSARIEDQLAAFLEPPLFAADFERSFATLYTAVYRPLDRSVELIWRGEPLQRWVLGVESAASGERVVGLG